MAVNGAGLGPRLAGKVAFITGAGMGMGREAAVLFAEHGARIGVADINKAAAEETVGTRRARGRPGRRRWRATWRSRPTSSAWWTRRRGASARCTSSTTTRACSGRTGTARCWRPTTAGGSASWAST